jgi:hypothetical protein
MWVILINQGIRIANEVKKRGQERLTHSDGIDL